MMEHSFVVVDSISSYAGVHIFYAVEKYFFKNRSYRQIST